MKKKRLTAREREAKIARLRRTNPKKYQAWLRERNKRRYRPGTLIYFGGAMHEVMASGATRVRKDLKPGTPKRMWKARWN